MAEQPDPVPDAVKGVQHRAFTAAPQPAADGSRIIHYTFSDESVARDGHTISTAGWQLDAFLVNPVFLWAHQADQPPIGRVVEISRSAGVLRGSVEYVDPDISPFADSIYRMVKGGFLNATSVSWMPLEWRYSTDKTRMGGIDFLRQELLEISQAPVPALPSALVTARAAGIDTAPIFAWAERLLDSGGLIAVPRAQLEELRRAAKMPLITGKRAAEADWKVGASRDLPVDDSDSWDGPAAAERMLDAAGFNNGGKGAAPDSAKARRGFLFYDAANPGLKDSYKDPIADIVGGELKVIKGGLRAAASRLPQTDVPQAVKDEARAVLDHYEEKAGMNSGDDSKRSLKRGLCECGWLAMVLSDLSWIQECVEFEADIEGDGSPVPQKLADAMKQLGAVLVEMTAEEVAELVAGTEADVEIDGPGDEGMRAARQMRKRIAVTYGAMRVSPNLITYQNFQEMLRNELTGLTRSGRVLSAENERCLRDAHGKMGEAMDMVRSVVDQAAPAGSEAPDEAETNARAARERRAKVRKLKAALSAD